MSEAGLLARADLSGLPDRGAAVVGFSGGADSTALAHWLLQHIGKERIVLAHVNHMLRGEEADRDEAAAGQFAQRFGLRFAVFKADVGALARERGIGLEECGRQVRYGFFDSLAQGEDDRILTAHNADDNAETILLNLCRGASLQGLCGIPPQRGKVLRPLLSVERREIEAYCGENGLSYVTDSTNLSLDFSRNRVRHLILPVLRELNPDFVQTAARSSRVLYRQWGYLTAEAERLVERARRNGEELDARVLRSAPHGLREEAVKLYLEEQGCKGLEAKHLEAAVRLVDRGGRTSLPGNRFAWCSQGVFSAGEEREAPAFSLPVKPGRTELPGGKVLILGLEKLSCAENGQKIHNLYFKNALDYDIMTGNLVARTRREGDRFAPAGRGVTKSLKGLFQENRVPAPKRGGMVLLETDGELVFCEGVGASQRFCVTERTKTALTVTIETSECEGK